MNAGAELDAKVLAAMGWTLCYDDTYWHPPADSHWDKRLQYAGIIVSDLGIISTSDAEAVRLCGPWLDKHCWRWGVGTDPTGSTAIAVRKIGGFDITTTPKTFPTRARAICELVLAVAEREAERKDPQP